MKKLKIGTVMLLSIILLSLLFSEFNAEVSSLNALTGPSFRHPFGFDSLGRDLLGRVAAGVLVSLSVSLVSVAISMAVGLFLAFMMSNLQCLTLLSFFQLFLLRYFCPPLEAQVLESLYSQCLSLCLLLSQGHPIQRLLY